MCVLCCAATRRRYAEEHAAYVDRVTPSAMLLQSRWRATAPSRYLAAALAAAVVIQSAWRMVRMKRLHLRLTNAILFLRKGGVLAKYRAGHITGERHNRFVQLSPDLTTLHWGGVDKAPAGVATTDGAATTADAIGFDEDDKNVKSLKMDDVTAVTDGAKTGLMKTMNDRALKSAAKPGAPLAHVPSSRGILRSVRAAHGQATPRVHMVAVTHPSPPR